MIPTPDPDTYGQYARASLLADYVELLALNRQSVGHATVADFLADSDHRLWDMELIQQARPDLSDEQSGSMSKDIEEARDRASIVFEQMRERKDVLGCHYPFTIADDDSEVWLPSYLDLESSSYVSILMLTIAHAFEVKSPHRPEKLFEEIVANVLRSRGLPSTRLAAHRRGGRSFAEALRIACLEVGLKAAPDAVPRRAHAQDEGVDVLCHLGWEEDPRPGSWGFVGQVTVGKSDSWERKIKEPSPDMWACLVGTRVPALPFLAVPHHVERRMMELLTVKGRAIVLDRLRLARFKDDIGAEEREVIRAVSRQEVEPLAG